jgi:hypothetical protein
MSDSRVTAALALLDQSLREKHCASVKALLTHLALNDGAALLAELGCDGNTAALWEQVTEEVAGCILPQDEIAALVAEWLPFPAAMQEFGTRALDAGANPLAPTLLPAEKVRLLMRLSRPAQVAFETYALAREVATSVVAQLR